MLNYKKRLVVVTYCIHFEVLVQLDVEVLIIIWEDSVAQNLSPRYCLHIVAQVMPKFMENPDD